MTASVAASGARRTTVRRAPALAAALLACVLPLAGCSDADSLGRVHHDDSGKCGPLSASSGTGGVSIQAPKTVPWYGSFGSFVLCARYPGDRISLRDIEYEADVEPLEVRTYLRTVRKSQIAFGDDGSRTAETSGFVSALGRPPKFDDLDGQAVGTFTSKINGHLITQSCEDAADQANGYTELLFVMKFGKEGGHVPRASINYVSDKGPADSGQYILDLKWAMTGCATKIPIPGDKTTQDYCQVQG